MAKTLFCGSGVSAAGWHGPCFLGGCRKRETIAEMSDPLAGYSIQHWLEACPQGYPSVPITMRQ